MLTLALSVFVLATVAIVALAPLAVRIGLVDRPDARKRHVGEVPLVGGIALCATTLCCATLIGASPAVGAVLVLGPVAMVVGAADDVLDLPARLRFVLQLILGAALALVFGIGIGSLDGIVSIEPLALPLVVGVPFTMVCLAGVLNATNMADGIDGLLGTFAIVTLIPIAGFAHAAGAMPEMRLALVLACGLGAYLCFNLGAYGVRRRVFLGDGGSMFVGLVLVVLLIDLTQRSGAAFSPTTAGWLLGVPLLDTVVVMARRLIRRRSPFAAGRDHLHHLLGDAGFSARAALAILALGHAAMVGFGVVSELARFPKPAVFWLFVVVTVGLFVATSVRELTDARHRIARAASRRIAARV